MSQYMTGYVETLEKLNESKIKRIAELEQENAALREDKERLDAICHGWRISHEVGAVGYPDYWFIWIRDWSQPIGEGETLREAIDAARKEAQP